jgi:hypothetical protein
MSMTLQPLSHIYSHSKTCAVIAMSGISGFDSFGVMLRHCMLGDLPVTLVKAACAPVIVLAQKEPRLGTFVLGDHPSLDVLSSLDYFVAMLCHCMLGDLSVTSFKSMCRRHPCSRRVVSWDFFLSESCYASVCWATYL